MVGAERGEVDARFVKDVVPLGVDSASIVFRVDGYRAVEMDVVDAPQWQEFFERNPEYFLLVNGQIPSAYEVIAEVADPPPAGWSFSKNWVLGFFNEDAELSGIASVVSDLIAPGVWHIGLFVVATNLHGGGIAQRWYGGIERWARDHGAKWLRLGVVEGNTRAERFWQGRGFIEYRRRSGITMGRRCNTVCVMVKALGTATPSDYLSLVTRDRPESE
jgi:GNAT superfamily N-acetyltransferase